VKITDVRIDGFGIWTNLAMRDLAGDATVFYGPNEAGKTTLMQFIRTVLYGFSKERRARYLPPVHGGRPGGGMRLSTMRGDFDVVRRMVAEDALESLGDVTLLDDDGNALGSHQLSSILGGVDESIFTNVFAIGLREIQELGTLNDSAAADQLYKLTSGLDRVSLIDVVRELADSRQRILPPDERPAELTQLLARREKLQHELDELATRGRRWPQLMAERADRGREIEQVEQGMTDVQRQIHLYDMLVQARDKWSARRSVEEQLAIFGPAADLPADTLEQLDQLNNQIKAYRRRLHGARKKRSSLREELSRHNYHKTLVANASRIQALGEHAPWIGSLEDEVERLQTEVTSLEREMETRRPQLEGQPGAARAKLPDLTPKTLALLRTPASRMNHLTKIVERAQAEAIAVKNRTDQALQRVTSELADLDESSLSAALQKTGARVAQLRRRIQVEERLEQLQMQRSEVDGQSHELFDLQVMPFDKMAWLFIAFVISAVMILGGILGGFLWNFEWYNGLLMTFFGFVGLGASIVWKLDWERNAERQLQSCERQLELLDQQIEETIAEREQLDQQLPSGGGPLDARLAAAERQLSHLEQLAPMDAQRHESGQHVESAERRAMKATEDLKDARKNWQVALRSAGLPESLSPNDVRHLVRSFRTVLTVKKQLNQRRDELENRRRELASLAGRINELFVELAVVPESDGAQARLKQLAALLAEQQNTMERRRDVLRQLKQLKIRWHKAVKGYEGATRTRRALLAKAQAKDEQHLRQMLARQHQAQVLRSQREELTHAIHMIVGEAWTEETMQREFTAREEDAPEQKRMRLADRVQQLRHELTRLHEERGLLGAEMKNMVADRRMSEARLELGVVEQQIEEAIEEWQVLSLTGLLLESVRSIYETTRQPETLREASLFLQRLTQGQYTRIWTPIEDKVLRVDDSQGRALSLEKLSSGTREAVFLALRLALVAGYARRGAALPLVLDDVLVNFDSGRVRAAADVLVEFARQGHQLFMFTCHEHIMQIFQSASAEVRLLPGRDGVQREEIPPKPPRVVNEPPPPPPPPPSPPPVLAPEPIPEVKPAKKRRVERRREEPAPVVPVLEEPVLLEPVAEVMPVAVEIPEPTLRYLPRPEVEEYRLAAEEPVRLRNRLDPLALLFAADEEFDEEDEPEEEVEETPEEETAQDDSDERERRFERRFTWESPEMYWRDRDEEAVA
jgi:uncharacterized protein YhaN